ncbi:copper resistance CopC/CopD family protein [Streptomyces bullii]|uniref:Copper resistance protein CopC n=1 Tax=Streptomyces bullii TaxID=349910 RepID=A0ABW0UMF7_9ACTN
MLLGTVLVLLLLGGAGPATAHAALKSTDPDDGAVLKSAPRALTLTFTESVGLLDDSFRVYDPDNHRVRLGEPRHADDRSDTARITLPADLGEGTFTVAWRVVSADSHPVSGAFTFSVGKPSPTTAAVPTDVAEHPLTGSLHDTARLLAYLAVALLIGTAAFAALCRPPDPSPLRRPLQAGWWTLLASTVVLLVLRGPYEAGTSPATALDPSALGRTLTSRPGLALLARLALLPVTAVFLVRLSRPPAPDRTSPAALTAGGTLAVGLALTWASAEHASAGIQVPLAMTSSVLHLLATAVWLGGLVALLTLLRRSQPAAALPLNTVARFSRIAFASVTVLVVTGVYQSWRGLGSWPALTATSYGRTLLLKLAAVVALLMAAGYARRWTTGLVAAEADAGRTAGADEGVETAVRERVLEPVGGRRPPTGPPASPDRQPDPQPGSKPEPEPKPASKPASKQREKPGKPEELGESKDSMDPKDPMNVAAPADAVPGEAHRRSLRRSVLAEVAVAAAVLTATTVLTGTLPGRAEAEAAQAPATTPGLPAATVVTVPFDVGTPGGSGTVQITLDPGRTGDNGVQAVVFGPDGGLTTIPELRLSFTLAARKIGPIDARLTDRGGYWATNDLTLPLPGTWTMKATVRVSELDQVSVTKPVRIAG